jgi:hypothetical protein
METLKQLLIYLHGFLLVNMKQKIVKNLIELCAINQSKSYYEQGMSFIYCLEAADLN